MGWVPVPGEETQAFIIGDQVLAANKHAAEATLPGVTDDVLPSASKFGLHDVYTNPGFEDPKGRFDLKADIERLFNVYVDDSPWTTSQASATILGAALRAAVPLPTKATCYFVGAPGKGKSWTAEQMMSFIQPIPGGWDALPGSASDTFASTENALSKTPVWVADDLAPSNDRNAAQTQENSIASLIRSRWNGVNKRRMNADMTAKATPPPMALFVLTAENEMSIGSIRQRMATIEFTGLSNDVAKDAADDLAQNTTVASRVFAAVVRMYIQEGERVGWAELVTRLKKTYENRQESSRAILVRGKDAIPVADLTRPKELSADLSMGLLGLELLCRKLGMDDRADQLTYQEGGLARRLTEQVKLGNQGREQETPGRMLISSIRQLLASGQAHIANADKPGEPPISDDDNSARINSLLGWRMTGQEIRPQGPTIGWYTWVKPRATDEPVEVLVISRDDAFNLAQKHYPKSIQFGASQSTSWKDVWNRGLIHPTYRDKKPPTGVVKQFRVGVDKSSRGRIDGIPLDMDTLFGGEDADDE